jgi:hypothetical protein
MKRLLASILLIGFLAVDFLFFHDILKPGETITFPQYLAGALSLIVFALSAQILINNSGHHRESL